MTSTTQGRGRIHPHQRDADDNVTILGATMSVQADHQAAVRETERLTKELGTKRDMRNRLAHIYKWWEENYPDYYAIGVRELTDDDKQNQDQFHYKNTHDLVYTGLNVDMVKAFLADRKVKANGKTSSHSQLRKYNDAILHGAKEAKIRLPLKYYEGIDPFLKAFKKETVQAKKNGMLDEREADPIPWSLFLSMCMWALKEGNIFVWVYSMLQWNCMARSINIGVLGLHNFRCGEDNVVCKYDKTKSDQSGEKLHDKHIYSNPFEPTVDCFLGLGVWCCLEASQFENSEFLFKSDDTKDDAASQRYCTQLTQMFAKHSESLRAYIREDRANSHGLRKGAATAASSGTTCPPPISSIAARGEWSLGQVLDLYWHFAAPGDHYLGRCIAGLDPNSENFAVLPPHFNMDEPMSNEFVRDGMRLMYGPILEKYAGGSIDPTGLLIRCLASVVYHSEFLADFAGEHPGHPFALLPLLNNTTLLSKLQSLVTLEPIGQIKKATGIPPYVNLAVQQKKILDLSLSTLQKVGDMTEAVREAVSKAYEDKAAENGQMTRESTMNLIDGHTQQVKEFVREQFVEFSSMLNAARGQTEGQDLSNSGTHNPRSSEEQGIADMTHHSYNYEGKSWDVPADFNFPKGTRMETGWRLWLQGMPGLRSAEGPTPIRPFRLLDPNRLPKGIRSKFNLEWKPIFQMMELAPDLGVIEDLSSIDAAYLDASLQQAKEYLATRVEYVFAKPSGKYLSWTVSTWSKHVRRSQILKEGTAGDKAKLPEETRFNKPRAQKKRKRSLSTNNRTPRRQRGASSTQQQQQQQQSQPQQQQQQQQEASLASAQPARRNNTAAALPDFTGDSRVQERARFHDSANQETLQQDTAVTIRLRRAARRVGDGF